VRLVELREAIAAELAASTSALSVHAHPAEVTAVPAIVIHPAAGAPYVEPFTVSGPGSVVVQLVLELIVSRSDMAAALEQIEELFAECVAALQTVPGTPRWQALADLGEVTVGGSDALSGQLSIAVPTDLPIPTSP